MQQTGGVEQLPQSPAPGTPQSLPTCPTNREPSSGEGGSRGRVNTKLCISSRMDGAKGYILVRMKSAAETGYCFNIRRLRLQEKLVLLRYDPIAKQRVLFTEKRKIRSTRPLNFKQKHFNEFAKPPKKHNWPEWRQVCFERKKYNG
ncbi:hypothetical protein IHE44_0009070 [Lamprotornis superbus]|uniref:Large ribosomal subunit protein bL33m n=1 Tax=Lamprotornis superbus TaxID=245042 RepID=A0A835NXP4_9PASS|nr:hypothetical protein IHE44_0009070 [Lamprotornis superbus]